MTALAPSSWRREPKSNALAESLARVLPRGYSFDIYHLSTPPNKTDPLCSPPPDKRPDRTYCENHFLAVTIDVPRNKLAGAKRTSPGADEARDAKDQVLVLGLEIYIFTTAYTTIFFVSKADSTGFLHLLDLPPGSPSPIREICSAFISYLIEHRYRKNIQSVVNLFARAQSQYLFPGSADNKGKHVLSDFGLVRWWCRVLNPLVEHDDDRRLRWGHRWADVKGYLIVPGLDSNETKALLPKTPASPSAWTLGHPMERVSHYTEEYDWVPPRCLIPRYPDDPKSRFRDELDEEAAKWKQNMGLWRSVQTLGQFWEMMAFRQECSSGRLTGFIWVVLDPPLPENSNRQPHSTSQGPTPNTSFSDVSAAPPSTPPRRRVDISANTPQSSPLKHDCTPRSTTPPNQSKGKLVKKKKKLSGRIVPRLPHIKTEQRNYLLDRPMTTAYYHWPPEGRGEKIVSEADYKRIVDLLLHLHFETVEKASGSTRRWIGEVGMGTTWGQQVIGRKQMPYLSQGKPAGSGVQEVGRPSAAPNSVTNLSSLVRKKPKVTPAENGPSNPDVISTSMTTPSAGDLMDGGSSAGPAPTLNIPQVNVLSAGLVRRKPKAA